MTRRPPTVSVLMPVRNGERFIVEAAESVLSQSVAELELVIVDDGSTDSTPRVLERLAAADSRVVVDRRQPGRNVAQILNVAAELSRAPLLARLDADDVALPNRFQRQIDYLAAHPEVALLGGQAAMVDERGREFGKAEYPLEDGALREHLRSGNPFVHSAVTMRREAFEAAGGYRENFDHGEDLDLWLRLADEHRIANLPDVVVQYRIHGTQLSLRKQEDQALFAAAAHASAAIRSTSGSDPFEGVDPIDEALLLSQGGNREELTASIVESITWLARTTDRAGYPDSARRLFDAAYAKARSDSGSQALVASVHRSMAHRDAEQGHRFRAKLRAAQARLAERRRHR
jgi:glycosyltransferase involved in cell wall biosynthesis